VSRTLTGVRRVSAPTTEAHLPASVALETPLTHCAGVRLRGLRARRLAREDEQRVRERDVQLDRREGHALPLRHLTESGLDRERHHHAGDLLEIRVVALAVDLATAHAEPTRSLHQQIGLRIEVVVLDHAVRAGELELERLDPVHLLAADELDLDALGCGIDERTIEIALATLTLALLGRRELGLLLAHERHELPCALPIEHPETGHPLERERQTAHARTLLFERDRHLHPGTHAHRPDHATRGDRPELVEPALGLVVAGEDLVHRLGVDGRREDRQQGDGET
jgi:hypothetical protein